MIFCPLHGRETRAGAQKAIIHMSTQACRALKDFKLGRKERLKQMKEDASKRRFGSVLKIVREQFVQEVTEASRQCWVIAHLYKDK